MEHITEIFSKVLEIFGEKTGWARILLILMIIWLNILVIENLTGFVFFESLNNKIALLKELNSLENAGIQQHSHLIGLYNAITTEITSYRVERNGWLLQFSTINQFTLWKGISGSVIWLVMLVVTFFTSSKLEQLKLAVKVYGVLALFSAFIGLLIPNLNPPLANFIILPVIEIAIIAVVYWRIR
jgi:hypothetical protein